MFLDMKKRTAMPRKRQKPKPILHMARARALKCNCSARKDRGVAMSRNKQRRFTNEFKREAVRLTLTSGRSVERVANDLGIAKSTLSRWRSEHEQSDLLEGPHEDVGKELTRLRKENEILRQERE